MIKPDALMTVEEKGLPFHKTPYQFGNLFILFHVKFPENLNDNQIGLVNSTLSAMKKNRADVDMDVAETVILRKFQEEDKNTRAEGGTRGTDSEEEEEQ